MIVDRRQQTVRIGRTASIVAAVGWWMVASVGGSEIVVSPPKEAVGAHNAAPTTMLLSIEDVRGSYAIPYIQSDRNLSVRVDFSSDPFAASAELRLSSPKAATVERRVDRHRPITDFTDLMPGEYSLQGRWLDGEGHERCSSTYEGVGIGAVVAALGDSITEGYRGRGFHQDDLNLSAGRFPRESVSHDGRNFPQFSPTTAHHMPSVNCFESWMTALNDGLTETWRRPIFIANEGWGGITTQGYLEMIRNDTGWKKRMQQLKPRVWLIHLGVNDERAHLKAADVRANLAAIVDTLLQDYHAKPANIFLAIPSYDYAEGAAAILQSYAVEIRSLVTERGLGRGPDFYEAFSKDRPRWYGDDPVHPNVEGMVYMARLWRDALIEQRPQGPQE